MPAAGTTSTFMATADEDGQVSTEKAVSSSGPANPPEESKKKAVPPEARVLSLPSVVKVGSRKSKLALWQTEHVIGLLKEKFPKTDFQIVQENTIGDNVQNRHLADLGRDAPGLFTKELEIQLLNGQTR